MKGAGCPRVTQPFATFHTTEVMLLVRLACVKRAASVHPEPGSNSPFEIKRSATSYIQCVRCFFEESPAPAFWFVYPSGINVSQRLLSIALGSTEAIAGAVLVAFATTVSDFQGSPRPGTEVRSP